MADVRALLRAEKAARAAKPAAPTAPPAQTLAPARKRKADGSPGFDRKKSRTDAPKSTVTVEFYDSEDNEEDSKEDAEDVLAGKGEVSQEVEAMPETTAGKLDIARTESGPGNTIDQEEWAAFEREVVNAPDISGPTAISALQSAAIISAAPMSAEELAAQAAEEENRQRTSRDAELEDEKEDAVRTLEEEFEAMEALEDRVRRLRDKREALRRASVSISVNVQNEPERDALVQQPTPEEEDESEDDEDLDDDFDDWKFGRV